MTKLSVISGQDCIKALKKKGFYVKRQEGSHIVLRLESLFRQVVVPDHKVLDRGTLRGIIRNSGLTVEELIALL